MRRGTDDLTPLACARTIGILYLAIIVCGLFSEGFVRSGVLVAGDPATTAQNILGSEGLFRTAFLADSIMIVCDAAVAALLYVLLAPAGRTLALVAAAFRLTQTAVLAMNLLHHHAALLLLDSPVYATSFGGDRLDALAYLSLDLHAHGYDLGLLFFGVHCLLVGWLIARSDFLPTWIGLLLAGASAAYITGTYTRFLLPARMDMIAPVYFVAIVAEVSLCLWLLIRGVDVERWELARGSRGRGSEKRVENNGSTDQRINGM